MGFVILYSITVVILFMFSGNHKLAALYEIKRRCVVKILDEGIDLLQVIVSVLTLLG